MQLELGIFPVEDLKLGNATYLLGRTLHVNGDALRAELLKDERLADCQFDIVKPGEAVRVIHVVDVVEPRVKVSTVDYFGGMVGSMEQLGWGRTNVLRGATVVVSAKLPSSEEAILDMAGNAGVLSKFSTTCNLVVIPIPREDLASPDASRAVLECGLRASALVARATLDAIPVTVETYAWEPPKPGLPKVAYICYLYSHGHGREQYLFGKTTRDILPTIIHPNQLLDGAVTYGAYTVPKKSPTFNHMNNAVVQALYRRHNVDLAVTGVIMVNHNLTFDDKRRSGYVAAQMAQHFLGCDGVVVTKDGGGQADVDLAECCDRCEELGLKTVLLVMASCGSAGTGDPLVIASRHANAIVTADNGNEEFHIRNVVSKVIGGDTLYSGVAADSDDLVLPHNYVVGIGDFQGGTTIMCRQV